MRAVEHWHRLPKEIVESLPLEMFKTQLDMVLGNLPWLSRSWPAWSWEVPTNLNYSLIQWFCTLCCRYIVSSFERSQRALKILVIVYLMVISIVKAHLCKRKAWKDKFRDEAKSYPNYTSELWLWSHTVFIAVKFYWLQWSCPYFIPLQREIDCGVN